MSDKLFKVITKDGRSCDGGCHQWDLPKDGEPGAWQRIRYDRPIELCRSGFHLTRNPASWTSNISLKSSKEVYVAEFIGETTPFIEDKIACREVRLVRLATDEELATFGLKRYKNIVASGDNISLMNPKEDVVVMDGKGIIVDPKGSVSIEGPCQLVVVWNEEKPRIINFKRNAKAKVLMVTRSTSYPMGNSSSYNTVIGISACGVGLKNLPTDYNHPLYHNMFEMMA